VSVHVTGKGALVWTASIALWTTICLSLQVDNPAVTFKAGLELELFLAVNALKVTSLKSKSCYYTFLQTNNLGIKVSF